MDPGQPALGVDDRVPAKLTPAGPLPGRFTAAARPTYSRGLWVATPRPNRAPSRQVKVVVGSSRRHHVCRRRPDDALACAWGAGVPLAVLWLGLTALDGRTYHVAPALVAAAPAIAARLLGLPAGRGGPVAASLALADIATVLAAWALLELAGIVPSATLWWGSRAACERRSRSRPRSARSPAPLDPPDSRARRPRARDTTRSQPLSVAVGGAARLSGSEYGTAARAVRRASTAQDVRDQRAEPGDGGGRARVTTSERAPRRGPSTPRRTPR